MTNRQLKHKYLQLFCFMFVSLVVLTSKSFAKDMVSDKRMEVIMRKIGHEVLTCLGDIDSRVLPIEKIKHQYKIPFESKLSFDPDDIVKSIDRVMKETQVANHYFVDVEKCEPKQLVHSYEISHTNSANQVACLGRLLPLDCYSLIITIVDESKSVSTLSNDNHTKLMTTLIFTLISFSLIGFSVYNFYRNYKQSNQKVKTPIDTNLISIGNFKFDQKNTLLISENKRIELSHKESKLLSVLNDSVNTTVHRDILLQKVWKDEGDYIGRTLDVFISKLRKKLEVDSSVNIITERGVGYRLVLNEPTS